MRTLIILFILFLVGHVGCFDPPIVDWEIKGSQITCMDADNTSSYSGYNYDSYT